MGGPLVQLFLRTFPMRAASSAAIVILLAAAACGSGSNRRNMDEEPEEEGGSGGTSSARGGSGGGRAGGSGGGGSGGAGGGSGGGGTPDAAPRDTSSVDTGQPADANPSPDALAAAPDMAAATGNLFVYAQDGQRIQIYAVDRATGTLNKKGNGVQACASPIHLQVDRAQRFVYGACNNDRGLVVLSIDKASGELTRTGFAGGNVAVGVGVHPSGKFALTSDYDAGVTVFRIDDAGKPTKAQGPIGTGAQPHGARFDGSGKFAYVTNAGNNNITQFSFNEATGQLSKLSPATVTFITDEPTFGGRKEPRYLVHSTDGKHIFVMGQRPPSVVPFKVGDNGTLGKVGLGQSALSTALDSDINGKDVILSPSGKFAYGSVNKNNKVGVFAIDTGTGAVTRKETVDSKGTGATQLAIDPAGQWLFVVHESSHTISVFRIDAATGQLTAVGTPLRVGGNETQAIVAVSL